MTQPADHRPMQQPSPEHPFACFIRILGKGKTGSRSLTREEAENAFGMLLRGEVEPLQLGAFLMLLRVKEETGEELAGFVSASRTAMQAPPPGLSADLDWSSYAGKRHQHPWFILSVLLLAETGHRVFIHGSDGHTQGRLYTEQALEQLGLPIAANWAEVDEQLSLSGFSYLPLRHFCLPLHEMMQLRHLLGLRSPVNTLARMINPLGAHASIQSVFHPAYATLHQETDAILGQPRAMVFKGDSGEVEIKPQANTRLHLLVDGEQKELRLERTQPERVASAAGVLSVEPLKALWRGTESHDYGLEATLATASAALLLLDPKHTLSSATQQARELWQQRNRSRLD